MKIAKIFATGISGDIRSEFTVYNVKDVKTIKLIEDIITIIEQEYSELSKAYQEKEKIYSSNPSIENKFEVEKAESAYITIAYLKDKLMF